MKIFIVNLQRDHKKRANMTSLLESSGFDYEFFNAVDGNLIYENNFNKCYKGLALPLSETHLTKGEIGCALSHLFLYKKMVKENIPIALILEDDVIFDLERLRQCLIGIEKRKQRKTIYLLNEGLTYLKTTGFNFKNFAFRKYVSGNGTYGYVIDKEAAEVLSNFIVPIRFEADFWRAFFYAVNVNVLVVTPAIIFNNDIHQSQSNIELERLHMRQHRSEAQASQFKRECKTLRYKIWNPLFKIFRFLTRTN